MNDIYKTLEMLIEAESRQFEELENLFHLLEEMTQVSDNFLIWVIKYCDEHKVPIWNEEQLRNYIRLSRSLLKETGQKISSLQELIKSRKLPLNKFHKRSPEDLPEP